MTLLRLLRLARRWFGRAEATRVFEPLIADWQHDAAEAPHGRRRAIAHVRGALAFAATLLQMAIHSATASLSVRRLLGRTTFWSAVFSLDAIADARHLPWATAGIAVLVSVTSWLPVVAMGAMWQSGRYARLWQVGLGITAVCALVSFVLAGWGQPLAAAFIDARFTTVGPERLMALPELLTADPGDTLTLAALRRERLLRAGPAVFALLSGIAAVAHLRSGRRKHRVFSAGYVVAGTLVCTAFVLFVNAARASGVDRSVAMMLATAAVMVPATGLFVMLSESERRLFVRYRGRRSNARWQDERGPRGPVSTPRL